MTFDVIILTYSIDEKHAQITRDTLKSLKNAEMDIKLKPLVIESGNDYDFGVETIRFDEKFNYNKALNLGLSKTKNKYALLCNNDLVYEKGFAERLYAGFKLGFMSLSPYCKIYNKNRTEIGDYIFQSYQVGVSIAGWCIAIDRAILSTIGKLNEEVDFWYSDNIYGEQIKRYDIKHGLVCNSFVEHLGSMTLNELKRKDFVKLTTKQKAKYQKAIAGIYEDKKHNT